MSLLWFLALSSYNVIYSQVFNELEKRAVFNEARAKADELNKPLLNYGCRYWRYAIDRSDVNADIVPRKGVPRFLLVTADTQRLPFDDKYFGVAYCSHVLEHCYNPDWILHELHRVSDYVYIITPRPFFLMSWLDPDHKWQYIGQTKLSNPFSIMGPIWSGLAMILAGI